MKTRFEAPATGGQARPQGLAEAQTSNSNRGNRYHVEVLGKALDILDVLRSSRTDLRLTDVAEKTGVDVSTTFRLLRTLEARGYVRRDPGTRLFKHGLGFRAYRIGYAQLSGDQPFSRKVTQGLMEAAEKSRVELLVADNRDSPDEAIKSAAWLISQKVDFVIEYEFHYRVAAVLANMFSNAGIPTLAIDIPQPCAIYFGANNYAVGSVGGDALARFAREKWRGRVNRILLLEIPEAGPVPHSRVIGTLDGLRSVLPKLSGKCVLHRNGKGTETGGYLATQRVLRSLSRRERLLIAAANDNSARGAIRAVCEAGRQQTTAIMAQGWGPDEALDAELRKPDSPLIGAVAYFPEQYGVRILPIVLQCLNRQPVSPAVYIEHKLFTKDQISSSSSGQRLAGSATVEVVNA
ncbi:MAG TPA: helix-turn-helix domain-containing protein [Terriglobales bacterium]